MDGDKYQKTLEEKLIEVAKLKHESVEEVPTRNVWLDLKIVALSQTEIKLLNQSLDV